MEETLTKTHPLYPNLEIHTSGHVRRLSTGNILTPCTKPTGYKYVTERRQGKKKNLYVHALVAECFLGDRSGKEVNHIDGDKSNNALSNLEYVTHKENMQHAQKSGLLSVTKLPGELTRSVHEAFSKGATIRQITKMFALAHTQVATLRARWSKQV